MRPPLDHMRLRRFSNGREHQIASAYGNVRDSGQTIHQGWDLEACPGTFAYAISDGTILKVNNDPNLSDYGRFIVLEFAQEKKQYWAFYAHLSHIMVRKGEKVPEGKPIAKTGQSGNAEGLPLREAHLHFEIRTSPDPGPGMSNRINPMLILNAPEVFLRA